jgi:excisionase family DNA binding protein
MQTTSRPVETARGSAALPCALRVDEACARYRISRSKLYLEIAAGRLKAVKCGSRTLIPTEAGDAWFNSLPGKAA